MKSSIHNALYEMHTTEEGKAKLKEFSFNIKKFAYIDGDQFLDSALEYEEKDITKSSSAYY